MSQRLVTVDWKNKVDPAARAVIAALQAHAHLNQPEMSLACFVAAMWAFQRGVNTESTRAGVALGLDTVFRPFLHGVREGTLPINFRERGTYAGHRSGSEG